MPLCSSTMTSARPPRDGTISVNATSNGVRFQRPWEARGVAKQQEYVLRTVEERDIRFIRLWFTDVLGMLKSVAVTSSELESAFGEGIGFDGSAVDGFARVQESDMLACLL